MSVVTASTSKGEKSKKFQSLDINNIYQGSATKPTQKSLPQKHGLQSLGKVPTARRAPANLPSLKAENGGNDPAVNLVPSGSAGWGKDDPTGGSGANTNAAPTNNKQLVPTPSGGGQNSQSNGPKHDQQQAPNHPGAGQAPNHPPSDLTTSQPQQQPHASFPPPHSHQQQPSWKNVATSSAPNSSQPAFLGQRSNPLFVQEFPSLTPNGTTDGQQAIQPALQGSASSGSIAQKLKGETPDALKYGPGPNLRPQSYGNWALGTAGGTPKQQSDTDGGHPSQQPQQPHPQQAARPSQQPLQHGGQQPGVPQNTVTSSFKFDVSTKPGAASITGIRKSASASNAANSTDFKPSGRPELVKKPHQPQARGPPPTSYQAPGFLQQQIIDVEKLKRLDELDHAESDWTKSDDTFDYNKKIASDDEDEFQSNWTDQIKPIKSAAAPPSGDHYGDHQQLNSSQPQQQQQPRRIVLPSSANSDFVHDEEKERQAKNEEVLKTIERAKRRREEEEQKYGKTTQQYGGSSQHYGGNSSSSSRDGYESYGRGHFDPPRRQHSGGDRNNRRSPAASAYRPMERGSGGGGGGSFGKFDVGGKDDEGYGFSGKKQQQTPPPLQQQPQQSSVPPRFKRNGMELHPVKRVSPPKEPSPDNDGGGGGSGDPPSYSSNSRASSIRKSPGCWDRHSTGSSSEPSATLAATTAAAAGPTAEKEPGNEPEPTASVVDPDRHFSGSTSSTNEKKDFSDLKFDGEHYDNWSGGGVQEQQQHSLEPFDSRPKQQQQPQPRGQGRDFTRNRKPRAEAVAAASSAPAARLDEPRRNNRGEPTRGKSDTQQQQTQPKKIILPNKNKGGGGGGGGSKKVDEPSPAAVVEAVDQEKTEVIADPPTDLMKSLALSADIGGVPTLDQLQPKEAEAPEVKKDPEAAQPQQKMHQPQAEPLPPPPQAVSQVEAASGWFAPRGQPSRRGRGGVTGSTAGQQRQPVSAVAPADSVTDQGKDVEWDASSDRSFEDKKITDGSSYFGGNRGGNRGSGRYNGGSGMPGGVNRQPNTKDGKRVSDRVGSGRDKLGGGVGNNAAYGGGIRDDTRRQNKLPPRLAKQKEQNRLASSGGGGGGGGGSGWGDITEPTSAGGFSTWDQSTTVMRQQQAYIGQQNDFGNFRSEEASKEGSVTTTPTAGGGGVESQNAPMQTIIFENTNFKGRQQQQQPGGPPMAGHSDRGFKSDFPIGFADAAAAAAAAAQSANEKDLRLDFGTFGGSGDSEASQNGSQKLPSRSPMHHVQQHPTTDDLNMKIASAKKIWEMSPAAPGDQAATATAAFGQGFQNATSSSQDPKAFVPQPAISSAADDSSFSTDKAVTEAVAGGTAAASNVAKVRPQQMPPHQQQQQPQVSLPQGYPGNTASAAAAAAAAGTPFQLDVDRAASLRAAMMGQSNSSNSYNRSGLPAQLQSPQSLLNQSVPPNLYQAFQLDHGRGVPPAPTSQLYPAYAPGLSGAAAAAQSVLLSSSGLSSGAAGSGSDMFGSQSQFRLQNQSGAFGPGPSAATTTLSNPVLLSQSMKTSQIGPIGTKANSYQTGSLGMSAGGPPPPPPPPPAGTSPLHLIPYDNTQANHYAMASTRLAAAANQTGQTAFYAALAASQQQSNRAAAAQSAAAASAAGFSAAAQGFQQAGAGAFGPNAALNAQMRSAVAAAAHAASQSSGPHGPPPPHLANYMAKANADVAAVQAAAAQIQAKRNQEIGFGGLSQHQFGGGGQQGKGGYGGGAASAGGGVNVSIAASVAAAAAAAAASSNGHSGSQAANVSSAVPSSTVTAAAAAAVANNAGGRNYSPTPIQRPAHQGKPIVATDDDSVVDLKDKKKKAEEN